MWLNIGFCIALFYVVTTQSNTPNDKPEEVFVDVIKNISRVNNVLQELISNYETLQKMYKSQENLDSSKYSDLEIDELLQNIKKKPRSPTSKATKKEKFAATEMYWSDHEEETLNNSDENISQPKTDHKKKGNVVDRDKKVVRLNSRTSTTTLKPEESSSGEFSESDENLEYELKKKIGMLPKVDKEKKKKLIPNSDEAQTEFDNGDALYALDKLLTPFIDTKDAKTKSRKIYIDKEKNAKSGSNIPYLVSSDGVKTIDISKKKHKPGDIVSHNIRAHKKNMFSDAISTKKTFYDLVKDTQIQVEAHNEIIMENVKHPDTNSEKKYGDEILNREKRRDIVKFAKINKKNHHKKEDTDKSAVNESQQKFLRAGNVRVAKTNVTHHKTKKHLKKLDDDTQNIFIDHKIESIEQETNNNNNHKMVDNDKEARDTDKENKTHVDNKRGDISHKKTHNDHEKANKRHKKTDIDPQISFKDHKMVNNSEEQRGTVAKSNKKKKSYQETRIKSSDESLLMDKNDTNVLREAYGEACMKVVVRKCYKACTKSTKLVCSQTKCKSSVKSKVKNNAKTACLQRFTAKELSASKSDIEKDENLFVHKRRALKENFDNLKEREFHVCLPTLSVQTGPNLKPSTNETNSPKRKMNPKTTDTKVSFNILRDRFERACKKLSYEKCRDACTCSWDSACSTYDCSKRLKSLYKKICKNTCKSAYELGKKSSGSSGSSSSKSDDSSNSS